MKKLIFLLFLPCLLSAQQEIAKPERATYYTAFDSVSGVYHVGITEPDQVTTTGQPNLVQSADEIGFLEATSTLPIEYTPLPAHGEEVAQGIFSFQGELVIVRQPHTRDTTFSPEQVPALFAVYRPGGDSYLAWIAQELVSKGNVRSYEGQLYICITPHLTQFAPPVVPALWNAYSDAACPAWVQPTGAQDAYPLDACVTHNGQEWINTGSNANVWEPGVFGWQLRTP